MDFRVGDSVVHWIYGLGQVVALEERTSSGNPVLYYVVRIQKSTICVPADDLAANRLRVPTAKEEFIRLFEILGGFSEPLAEGRFERKAQLRNELADGKIESVCRVIRDLTAYSHKKHLNDDDKNTFNRVWNSLCSEYGFTLSLPFTQAETVISLVLNHPSENVSLETPQVN
jgi:RNA polymerase-interacting CarD/CdnL/TRCF family regulator